MTERQIETLYTLLDQFFDEYDITKRNFIPRNKVAKLIKSRLKEVNRWKDANKKKKEEVIEIAKSKPEIEAPF